MKMVLAALTILISSQSHAHGEDKLGPHGGLISMPGAFHVELLADSPNLLKVYLLDVEWKNPIVKNSSVKVFHGANAAKCIKKEDYFVCRFPKEINLFAPGILSVESYRENSKGKNLEYPLPLKIIKN